MVDANNSHLISLRHEDPLLVKFNPFSEPKYFPLAEPQARIWLIRLNLYSKIDLSLLNDSFLFSLQLLSI